MTLDELQYDELARIARRDGKKLAAVVRESIERYCLGPEAARAKQEALKILFSVSTAAPRDYAAWKREYAGLKSEAGRSKRRARKARRSAGG